MDDAVLKALVVAFDVAWALFEASDIDFESPNPPPNPDPYEELAFFVYDVIKFD